MDFFKKEKLTPRTLCLLQLVVLLWKVPPESRSLWVTRADLGVPQPSSLSPSVSRRDPGNTAQRHRSSHLSTAQLVQLAFIYDQDSQEILSEHIHIGPNSVLILPGEGEILWFRELRSKVLQILQLANLLFVRKFHVDPFWANSSLLGIKI